MPQINILPAVTPENDPSEAAVRRAAECSEMVECSEILGSLRRKSDELCRDCDGRPESVERALEEFDAEIKEKTAGISGEKAALFLRDVCSELQEKLLKKCVENEVESSFSERAKALERAIEAHADALAENPDEYGDVCTDIGAVIAESGLPESVRGLLEKKAAKEFAAGVLKSRKDVDPAVVADFFNGGRAGSLFSAGEREALKEKTVKKREAFEGWRLFSRWRQAAANETDEEAVRSDLQAFLNENPYGLTAGVLENMRFFAQICLRTETDENRSRASGAKTALLAEIKRLFEQKGEEDAALFLCSCGLETEDPDLFGKIRGAFENGTVGAGNARRGYLNAVSAFVDFEPVSEGMLLAAFLCGEINGRDFENLALLCQQDSGEAEIFLLRTALKTVMERASDDCAAANAEIVMQCFAKSKQSGASAAEMRQALNACVGG